MDANLLRSVLQDDRVFRDLEELLGRQLDVEAIRKARRGQQLPRLGEVLLALGYRGIRGRINRREGAVVADNGPAVKQALDQQLAIQAQRNCATNALIGEGAMSVRICTC